MKKFTSKIIIIFTMLIVFQANGSEPIHRIPRQDIYLRCMIISRILDNIECIAYENPEICDQTAIIRDLIGEGYEIDILD